LILPAKRVAVNPGKQNTEKKVAVQKKVDEVYKCEAYLGERNGGKVFWQIVGKIL
jgi:hypothetical protein